MAPATAPVGLPLEGVRVVELGGIGPTPYAGMLLSDLGAEVVRIERPGRESPHPVLFRGQRSIRLNLKSELGLEAARRLALSVDVVVEGFRPGVAERLGLGPIELRSAAPGLVYGRMTGWGQEGPLARVPGHDINYLSLTGALHVMGPPGSDPMPPLNLLADFAGGGTMLALGVVSALVERARTGLGRVIDAAMIDGVGSLMALTYGYLGEGSWQDERGVNKFDGAVPYYRTYRCADDRYVAVGCLEAQFYAALLEELGLADDPDFADQTDTTRWPVMHQRLGGIFATRARDEWAERFVHSDACVTPVLSLTEAPRHPHNVARSGWYVGGDGIEQPAPSPRFGPRPAPAAPPAPGADTADVLQSLGFSGPELDQLLGRL